MIEIHFDLVEIQGEAEIIFVIKCDVIVAIYDDEFRSE